MNVYSLQVVEEHGFFVHTMSYSVQIDPHTLWIDPSTGCRVCSLVKITVWELYLRGRVIRRYVDCSTHVKMGLSILPLRGVLGCWDGQWFRRGLANI